MDFETDDHADEMLAWLLPVAVTVISIAVLLACAHFEWLQ